MDRISGCDQEVKSQRCDPDRNGNTDNLYGRTCPQYPVADGDGKDERIP